MTIEVGFNPYLVHRDTVGTDHQVGTFRFTCRPYRKSGKWGEAGDLHVDVDALDSKGEVPSVAVSRPTKGAKTQFRPLSLGTALREQARVLMIDHRRDVLSHLPTRRGSALARLLDPARKELDSARKNGSSPREKFEEAYAVAMQALRTDQVREVEETIGKTAKRMLGFLGAGANSTYRVRSQVVSTVKKSTAKIPWAWVRRNSLHDGPLRRGAGPRPCRRRTVRIAVADTRTPSFSSSPRILR
jgi:hypothetical protein